MLKRIWLSICLLALAQPVGFAAPQDKGLTIPEGTELQLTLLDPVSSKLSEPGDEVVARLRRDVVSDGLVLLREGTEFIGRVTLAQPAKRPFKGGRLHLTIERVRIDGREQKVSAIIRSASDFTRDEKVSSDSEGTLKGGADGGKILQNVGTAAGIGGIGATIIILAGANDRGVGGLGGVGISRGGAVAGASVLGASAVAGLLLTKGKEVRLDANAVIRLKLERPLSVD